MQDKDREQCAGGLVYFVHAYVSAGNLVCIWEIEIRTQTKPPAQHGSMVVKITGLCSGMMHIMLAHNIVDEVSYFGQNE